MSRVTYADGKQRPIAKPGLVRAGPRSSFHELRALTERMRADGARARAQWRRAAKLKSKLDAPRPAVPKGAALPRQRAPREPRVVVAAGRDGTAKRDDGGGSGGDSDGDGGGSSDPPPSPPPTSACDVAGGAL